MAFAASTSNLRARRKRSSSWSSSGVTSAGINVLSCARACRFRKAEGEGEGAMEQGWRKPSRAVFWKRRMRRSEKRTRTFERAQKARSMQTKAESATIYLRLRGREVVKRSRHGRSAVVLRDLAEKPKPETSRAPGRSGPKSCISSFLASTTPTTQTDSHAVRSSVRLPHARRRRGRRANTAADRAAAAPDHGARFHVRVHSVLAD
jgi:hypothetical protein